MVSPSVLLIGLFGLIPVIWSFVLSFQHNDLQTPATSAGFSNYRELVHDPVFREAIQHTLVYTVIFVPVTLVLSLLAAAALNRRVRGISIYRLAVFIPVVTSTVATGVIFTWLLDPTFGLVNAVLQQLGLPTSGFFASPDAALYCGHRHDGVGVGRFRRADLPRRPAGRSPPTSSRRPRSTAARKAGAFWRIQVPLLRPVTAFLLVWLTINALQLFDEVYVTTKGGPLHATTVVVYYIYEQAFEFFHAGYAAAIATVLFAVIAVITLVQLRFTRDASEMSQS